MPYRKTRTAPRSRCANNIFSVDVYEDLIGIRSTADWAKGNADVPFMKEVKTNYAASNEADGVIIDGCGGQI